MTLRFVQDFPDNEFIFVMKEIIDDTHSQFFFEEIEKNEFLQCPCGAFFRLHYNRRKKLCFVADHYRKGTKNKCPSSGKVIYQDFQKKYFFVSFDTIKKEELNEAVIFP